MGMVRSWWSCLRRRARQRRGRLRMEDLWQRRRVAAETPWKPWAPFQSLPLFSCPRRFFSMPSVGVLCSLVSIYEFLLRLFSRAFGVVSPSSVMLSLPCRMKGAGTVSNKCSTAFWVVLVVYVFTGLMKHVSGWLSWFLYIQSLHSRGYSVHVYGGIACTVSFSTRWKITGGVF